jgi:hypothetical protein
MKFSQDRGDAARLIIKADSAHDFSWVVIVSMPFPLHKRELIGRQLCFTDADGDLAIAFAPVDLEPDYGVKTRAIRARTTGIVRFSPINDRTQCAVTLHQFGDIGGYVPASVFARQVGRTLAPVVDMREAFQRDDEIDTSEWSKMSETIM